MAASREKKRVRSENGSPIELRGPERTFQFDRDTLIIYTGIHDGDLRPFLRIGAGGRLPGGILKHIENVILTDRDPANVGLENYWLHQTLNLGGDVIRYVGNKDQVSRMYSYSGVKEEVPDETEVPVELLPYKPIKTAEQTAKERSMINFYETGNVNVSVDGSRVLDLLSYKKSTLHIDKEYELIFKVLRKMERRCDEGRSFLVLDESTAPGFSMYWNMEGEGLLVNPPSDYQHDLFANLINPDKASMVFSVSPYLPGFVEAMRRRNALGAPLGVCSLDMDKVGDLKKLYANSKFRTFASESGLPFDRSTMFFLSKTGSHALLSTTLSPKSEYQIQMVFPTGVPKVSKKFEYLKAPHDLEFDEINDRKELKREARGGLILHRPGKDIKLSSYGRGKLSEGFYPLVGQREYHLHYGEQPTDIFDQFITSLALTDFENPLKELFLLLMGLDFSEPEFEKKILEFEKIPVPKEIIMFNNISETLRFFEDLPKMRGLDPRLLKRYQSIRKKYSLGKIQNRDWLELKDHDVEFSLLFTNLRKTFLLVNVLDKEIFRFQFPPPVDALEGGAKAYRTLLKQQSRRLDRVMDAPQGYREGLDMMEHMLEDRLRLLAERQRFKKLLEQLGMSLELVVERPVPSWVPASLAPYYLKMKSLYQTLEAKVRSLFS